MTCKKSELVTAVNSYAAARTTGDANLQRLSSVLLEQLIDSLEFAEEVDERQTEVSESEVVSD
jgi:hypothetical protein